MVTELGLECFVAAIDPDLADTAAFCAAYEVPLEPSANCVVVSRPPGRAVPDGRLPGAGHRPGRRQQGRSARHLDVRKISFAPMDDAVSQTAMEYGGITPVGLPADWPILVDTAVAAQDWVVVGSGIRGSKILISGRRRLPGCPSAEVLTLRQPG